MRPRPLDRLTQIGVLIAAMYVIEALSVATDQWPLRFGVVPRTLTGLRGIFFSPLLHGGWAHLIANTAPLAILLALLALNPQYAFGNTAAALWVATGAFVWLIGRPGSLQIGASGVIYALASFLVVAAFTTRDVRSALLALVVIFLYGGIVWGLLPIHPGISWEGHLSGVLAGILVARLAARPPRRTRARAQP